MALLQQLPTRMHHHAYVVRDQEATRHFYEDVLGIPLVATWCEKEDLRGKVREYCHTFFGLGDGSALAFFQFADPADHDILGSHPGSLDHIALAAEQDTHDEVAKRLADAGHPYRVVNHGYCVSLYTTDPDGLTVELTVDHAEAATINEVRRADAHSSLARWLGGDRTPNNDWRAEAKGA